MGKLASQGIVDHLFPRCPRAVRGLVDESRHVGVQGQGSTHIDIIVPQNSGIKMLHRLAYIARPGGPWPRPRGTAQSRPVYAPVMGGITQLSRSYHALLLACTRTQKSRTTRGFSA